MLRLSARTLQSIRKAFERTFEGKADIYGPTRDEGDSDIGTTTDYLTPRIRNIPIRVVPVGAEEELFGVSRESQYVVRGFCRAEVDLRTTDEVDIRDYRGRRLGRWKVTELKEPHTGQEWFLEALLTQSKDPSTPESAAPGTTVGGVDLY